MTRRCILFRDDGVESRRPTTLFLLASTRSIRHAGSCLCALESAFPITCNWIDQLTLSFNIDITATTYSTMNDDWLKEAVLAAWQDRVKGMTLHEIEEFIRQRIRQPAAVPDRLLPNEQARGPPPPPSPPASSVGPRDNVEREIVHVHIKNESPDPVSHAIKRDRSVTPDHRAKSVRRILPESGQFAMSQDYESD